MNQARDDLWCRRGDAIDLAGRRRSPQPVRIPADPAPAIVDLSRAALLVIDMQNDFCHQQGWFPAIRGVDPDPLRAPTAAINRLSAAFRAARRPVLFVNWGVRSDLANLPAHILGKGSNCGAELAYGDASPSGRGEILATGSWGADLLEEINREPDDFIVHKHRLSGFKDNELDQILRRHDVTTLFYAGINTDRCVFATLMDGSFEGYDSVLVTDACATPSPDYVRNAILYLVRLLYGFTATSQDISEAIDLVTQGD